MTAPPPAPNVRGNRFAALGRAEIALGVSALLLAALFAIATLRIPLVDYFPDRGVSIDFKDMLGPSWQHNTVLYVGFVAATFAVYFVALAVAWAPRGHLPPLLVLGAPAVFALILLSMYPPTAVDIFHYQASVRVLWVHGGNPLTVSPDHFPYPIGYSWAGQPAPYGPLWPILAAPAALLPGDHFVAGLYAFKLIAAASLLGCAVMVWRIVALTRPGQQALAVVLFAWNPFVLLRVVGNGHNDLVMMLFLLVSLELTLRRRWQWAFVALACSALVKYVSLLAGPPLLIYLWTHAEGDTRTKLRTAAEALGMAAFTVVIVFAPLWEGLSTFDTVRGEAQKMITSTPILIGILLSGPPGNPETADQVRTVLRIVFMGIALLLTWQARRSFDHLVMAVFTILFLYLLLPTGWFRPWYMLWPVTIAALRPRSWLAPCLVAITLFGAFPDLVEQYRNNWSLINGDYTMLVAAPIVVAFVPAAFVWLVGVARYRGWMLDGVQRAEEPARESASV